MKKIIICAALLVAAPAVAFEVQQHNNLGQYGASPFSHHSGTNGLGAYGNPFENPIDNPDGAFGMPYGGQSDGDELDSPKLFGGQGDFWAKFSVKPNASESASGPYGRFGNPYSADINENPYGAGSPYATNPTANPYSRGGSVIIGR